MKKILQVSKHILMCMMLFSVIAVYGKKVDENTAQQIGINFLKSQTQMISNNVQLAHIQNVIVEGSAIPCYYVFNVNDNAFVMVAADDCVKPILGYSTNGTFDVAKLPLNMSQFLQEYQKEISQLIVQKSASTDQILQQWDALKAGEKISRNTNAISPLLSSSWNQDDPYNTLCPEDAGGPNGHVYAGCVATAMAQVINYWNFPSHGYGNHSYNHSTYGQISADFASTTYDYSLMPDAITASSPEAQIYEVSLLTFHCAVSVEMDFGPNGSGAYSEDAAQAFRMYFGYPASTQHYYRESYEDEAWISMLQEELYAGRPMLYHGSGSEGHAFVCDGCDDEGLFHFNWGWSGYLDGYFSIDLLNPSGSDFSQNQGAVMGIQGEMPSNCESPSNLQVTVASDNTLNYTWDAPLSVENPRYKIYIGSLVKYSDIPSYSINLPITGQICARVSTICDDINEESDPTDEECVTLYPVSISETKTDFQIYPNPVQQMVTIEGKNIDQIFIYNIMGQLQATWSVDYDTSFVINTTDYLNGIYIIKVVTKDGKISSQRMAVAR